MLNNGNFVTVYNETDDGRTDIYFVQRTESGTLDKTDRCVVANATGASVASLAGGGLVVAYVRDTNILAYTFVNSHAFLGTTQLAGGANDLTDPVVVALPDGGFVVAWDDKTRDELAARQFNADGTPNGDPFTVENVRTSDVDMTLTGDGRVLFAWLSQDAEVFASICDPRDTTIDPGAFDVVRTNVLSIDVIATGLQGSTVLAGMPGDTVLG